MPFVRPTVESLEARRLLSVDPVPRPAWNTGTGFFVSGNKVYDANGYEFIIRGPNQNQWWGNPTENLNAIDHVARTGANATRAVFNYADVNGGSNTPTERKTIVERYLANNIVPIVEDHATTNETDHESPTALAAVVDNWLNPANVQWLQQYEQKVILNIANEWGPTTSVWRDTYITQVQRLRNAGINALIMLDAGGWGQDINTIKNYAAAVQAADPQHNVVFSIHFYSQWRTEDRAFELSGSTWDIQTQLTAVRNMGLPIVAGEFSWEGVDSATYRTRRVLEVCSNLGIGYMGWAWNYNNPSTLNMLPGTTYQYNSNADLTAWGDLHINDPDYGTKATAKRATVFVAPEAPRLIFEKTTVMVPEAGQGVARVRLHRAPIDSVNVNISKVAGGDANLNLAGASSLVFTPDNWDQYQPILLSAASDADTTFGTARFQLTATGLQTIDVIAKELDSNIAPGAFTLNPTDDRDTQTTGDANGVATTASASRWNTFLMKFSLANIGGKSNSATLRVYKNQTTSNLIGRAWMVINDAWTQATAQASLPVKSYPIDSKTMSNGVGYVDFNVGSVLNQELFADRTITLAISTDSDNWTSFQTREGVNKPQLVINSAEAVPPIVTSATFDPLTAPNRFTFTFSESVFASLSAGDLVLESLTNPSQVLTLSSPIDLGGNSVAYSISPAIVPDGNYRATLVGAGVTDAAGNALLTDTTINYYSLAGDANRDRHVDQLDQAIVTANLNQPGNFSQGDFNGDGVVNAPDQTILDSQWHIWLPSQGPLSLPTTSGNDQYVLQRSGTYLHAMRDGATPAAPTYRVPVGAISSIALDGAGGDDSLTILGSASANHVVFNSASITFDGLSLTHASVESLAFDGARGGDDLTILGGTRLRAVGTQVLAALTIDAGSTFDLGENSLVLDYTGASLLAVTQGQINTARNGGAWDGIGITSSTARDNAHHNTTLAAMEASDFKSIYGPAALFAGEAIDDTAVLVKYTYYGDTDFNGVVNFDDYSRIDTGFSTGRTGWLNGDFDGNGTVNFDDYSLIDLAFNTQLGALRLASQPARRPTRLR